MKKLILLSGFIIYCYSWQSSPINYDPKYKIEDCINLDLNKKHTLAVSNFDIEYVENSNSECINPYSPSIKIHSKSVHNAWLQVVHTNHEKWRVFIDSTAAS